MVYRLLIGVGLTMLGYYLGQQIERDASTRERLRKRREAREREGGSQITSDKKHSEPPGDGF